MNLQYDKEEQQANYLKDIFMQDFKHSLYQEKNKRENFEIIFLCVGTDRMTGDCLGPLVGTRLEEKLAPYNIFNITIYGTLKENLCYSNMKDQLEHMKMNHPNACVVVIDAALSDEEKIGKIFVEQRKMTLGKGLHKSQIKVGDISIKAVVGKNYKLPMHNFSILQNISLNSIIALSEIIADGICEVIKYIE